MRRIMEDNKGYSNETEETVSQEENVEDSHEEEQAAASVGSGIEPEEPAQDVQFMEQPDEDGGFRNAAPAPYQSGAYQSDQPYQSGASQSDQPYQSGAYQSDQPYQSGAYPTDQPYQSGASQGDQSYQNGAYQNPGYQSGAYYNGAYSGTNNGGSYQQYNQYNGAQPYQNTYQNTYQNAYQNTYQNNGQMELEEPVKISEWVLAMVLMMIPCVNIVMMFVWAFSSTEKKSKSNFFKAYLIFFGISMGVMLFAWIAIVFFAMLAY